MNESETNLSHPTAAERCKYRDSQEATKIAMTFAYSLLLITAVAGNVFVITVARKRLTARNPFNFLIINLAASDIIYAVFAAVTQLQYIFFRTLWFPGGFGVFLCKIKEFAFILAIVASILTLTFMSIEKHLAILYVMKTPLSTRNVCRVILALWFVSCFISSTELIKFRVVPRQNDTGVDCNAIWVSDYAKAITIHKIEYTIKFFLLFVFPLAITMTMYGRIIRFLWRRQLPGNRSTKNERKIRKQSRRIVLMLVTMTVVFAVGWFPVHVNHYLIGYEQINFCLPPYLPLLLYWIAHVNCAINPCLYLIFNKDYKDEFRRLLKCCRRCSCCGRRRSLDDEVEHLPLSAFGTDSRRDSLPFRTKTTVFHKHH